ncbi:MAG: CHASE2 domain-containing protein [Cyanobacteria bacterium J06635_1]
MGDVYAYQPGGSLPPDAPSYVMRQADYDLFEALQVGTYCYVLNARQMGKSSLRVHTVEQLFEVGVRCAEVELLGIGSQQITANQWYGGIIQVLIASLGLRVDRRRWLADHEDLSPVQRLGTFIEEIVLPQTDQPLVIFFDEIDSVLGLNFPTDEFFGLVRNWYEKRAVNPAYQRLTVVMLGVATPSDLMQGKHSTPFNIGQAIELQGFSFEEARPLAAGLAEIFPDSETVLREILAWTGGQPFLTQKLCWMVCQEIGGRSQEIEYRGKGEGEWSQEIGDRSQESGAGEQRSRGAGEQRNFSHAPYLPLPLSTSFSPPSSPSHTLTTLIQARIIDNWETQDEPEHLRTIRNRVLRNARYPERLLKLYRQILKRGALRVDTSPEQMELRLTGLVTQHQGKLKVFNQIYRTVFDDAWVAAQLKGVSAKGATPLPLWRAMFAGVGATALVLLVRSQALLQPLELLAFDQLMRSQPAEPADDRFLIITVSEADIQYQDRLGMVRQGSLSDEALLQVWQKLTPHEPRVVGLDFYHDFPFSPALTAQLTQDERFIAVCEIGQTLDIETPSIPAPPNLSGNRVGFTDFASDPDYRIRRQTLGMDRTEACDTDQAFNLKVALQYLAAEGITLEFLSLDWVKLGERTIRKIPATAGGYRLDPAEQAGYQILVNYRSQSPRQIALRDVLEGNFDADLDGWVRDRIVLIGLADPKDAHFTPVQPERMLGVTVHAQMASQLISATLDGRPLLWWLPEWGEGVWIVGWAVVGSVVVWGWQQFNNNRIVCVALVGGTMIILIGTCYGVFLMGGWLPLVPPLLALAIASGGISILIARQTLPPNA